MKIISLAVPFALISSVASCGSEPARRSLPDPDQHAAATASPAPKLRLQSPRLMPSLYHIELRLDPAQTSFTGTVRIEGEITTATTDLVLNAHGIEVDMAEIAIGDRSIPLSSAAEGEEFIRLTAKEPLATGAATVTLVYRGSIDEDESYGIFRQSAAKEPYLFTQFESRAARRAFPSVDQPDLKVPMQLALEVPEAMMALANTPEVAREESGDGFVRVQFAATPPLPTYLLAFAVGPFDAVEIGESRSGVPVRAIVPRGRGAEARWVVESTLPILAILEDEFGSPYPFKKLDMISVPATGSFGAMENPGLITFTESLLLAKNETQSFRRAYASVAAHELAHQWFGNLVTCAWWDDIWLNEAFATWAAAKTMAKWKPEWRPDASWISRRSGAMHADRLASARMIHQPIVTEGDIGNAFDGITYSKGASVIAMVEAWVGREAFQAALQHYLKTYSWKSPTTKDFLATMDQALDGRAGAGFVSFLDQPGTPEVSFALQCDADKAPSLQLTQTRYAPIGSKLDKDLVYSLPVCVRYPGTSGIERECLLFDKPETTWELRGARECPSWILPNADSAGYYRSALAATDYGRLLAVPELTPAERLGLLDDVGAAVAAGRMPLADALALVPKLADDADLQVVAKAAELADIRRLVAKPDRARYAKWLQKHFGARARKLGWNARPSDSDEVRMLRPRLLGLLIFAADDQSLARPAKKTAEAWIKDPDAVDPDIAELALSAAARYGDASFFDQLVARLHKTVRQGERRMIYAALSAFDRPELFDRTLSLALDEQYGYRETVRLFQRAAYHRQNGPRVLEFFTTNTAAVLQRIPEDARTRLARGISPRCEAESRGAALAFLRENVEPVEGGPRVVAQAMEAVDLCIARKAALKLPKPLPR